mmetsp:Transcript_29838/g.86638  ORF Transcript_29838/g.86638 Transcript_29838/m.86638 type:complete len:285 (+) Transcript_29838:372-1226(+)
MLFSRLSCARYRESWLKTSQPNASGLPFFRFASRCSTLSMESFKYSLPFGRDPGRLASASSSASPLPLPVPAWSARDCLWRFSACFLAYSGSAFRFCSSITSLLFFARPWFMRSLSSKSLRSRSFLGGAVQLPSASSAAAAACALCGLSSTAAPPCAPFRIALAFCAAFAEGAASSVNLEIWLLSCRVGSAMLCFLVPASPHPTIIIGTRGFSSLSIGTFEIARMTSMPSTTWPKTMCFPSRRGHFFSVIKNCEPFEFRPLFAMLSTPACVCRREKSSSLKVPP